MWVGLWEANNTVRSQSERTHKTARKGKTDICVKDYRRMKKGEGNFTRQPNLVGMTSPTVSMNDTHTASEDLLSV
jgi:hypothetical protein